jgi:hypothetical protein
MAHANEETITINPKSEYAPFIERLNKLHNERLKLEGRRQKIDEALVVNGFEIGACLAEARELLAKTFKGGTLVGTPYGEFVKAAEALGYGESTANKYVTIHKSYLLQELRKTGCLHGEGFTTLYEISRFDEETLAAAKKDGLLKPEYTKPITYGQASQYMKDQRARIGAEIEAENRQREADHAKAAEIAAAANAATEAANAQAPATTETGSVEVTPTMTEGKDPSLVASTYFRFVLPTLEPGFAAAVEKAIAVLRGELPELQGYRWEISLKPIATAATKAA